jgi:hypothetical protein
VSLTVTGGGDTGSVTATPVVSTNSPWFNELQLRLANTSTLTALTVTVVVQRTPGVGYSGRTFAVQTSGNGSLHPTSGDTYTVAYTSGGQSFTTSGTF